MNEDGGWGLRDPGPPVHLQVSGGDWWGEAGTQSSRREPGAGAEDKDRPEPRTRLSLPRKTAAFSFLLYTFQVTIFKEQIFILQFHKKY